MELASKILENQVEYLTNEKIAKYSNHYFARFNEEKLKKFIK